MLRIRIRDPVPFWPQDPDPGSGIRNRFFSGSRIPTPYFLELSDKFLGKKFYNSLKTGPIFFLRHLKNKIIFNFEKFVATKKLQKSFDNKFFSPLSFVAVFGSEIRDPEWVKIRIRDKHPGFATLIICFPSITSHGSETCAKLICVCVLCRG